MPLDRTYCDLVRWLRGFGICILICLIHPQRQQPLMRVRPVPLFSPFLLIHAQTYAKLGNKEESRKWLKICLERPSLTAEVRAANPREEFLGRL